MSDSNIRDELMHGASKYKVPEGKLIEIRMEYNGIIKKIEILGDFFVYPEESIYKMEKSLVKTKTDASESELAGKIRAFVELNNIEMIGITPEALAKAIKMAVKG